MIRNLFLVEKTSTSTSCTATAQPATSESTQAAPMILLILPALSDKVSPVLSAEPFEFNRFDFSAKRQWKKLPPPHYLS